MKRSFSFSASVTVGAIALISAAPALAQDYSYDITSDEPAAALAGLGVWAVCCMLPIALLAVFNIWMLIDAALRQEHEYPNSTGNSKLIWILLLILVGLVAAVVYYFMVFRQVKRGSAGGPPMAGPSGGYRPPVAPQAAPPPAPPMAPPSPPMAPPPPPPGA